MGEKIISPGVFTKEVDQTFLPAAIGDIGAVVVGPTVKGPALTPTVIRSYSEFQAAFGDVFRSGSSYYQYLTSMTAKNYLKHSGTLTVVRVMGSGYTHASATVSSSLDPAILGGGTQHTGSITITGSYGGEGVAPAHSASLTPGGGYGGTTVNLIFTGSNYLQRTGLVTDSSTTLYFTSKSNAEQSAFTASVHFNNSSSLVGLSFISASATGSSDGTYTSGIINFTYKQKGSYGVINGNPTGSNTASKAVGLGGSYIDYINITGSKGTDFASEFTVKNFAGGSDYATSYRTPFKLHTLSHGKILNNSASQGTNNILTDGTQNNIRWEIGSLNKNKGTFSLLIRRGDDIINRKQILETWNNVSLDPNSSNYIARMIGDQTITIQGTANDPYLQYTGKYPNKSKYVRVEVFDPTLDYLDENGNVRNNALSASLPSFHSGSNSGSLYGSFSDGDDGAISHPIQFYENISNTNTQGFNLGTDSVKDQYITALNLLSNADEYDFNLLLLPGVIRKLSNHTSVITKAIDVCEKRGDAFVIIDSVENGVNIANITAEAKNMDSNYAATYWPWVQVSDKQLGKHKWVPPSVVMAGIYAFNDKVAAPWFAPAGMNRGGLETVVQAERKLTHANRDELYDAGVNPIATFPGQGVTVWGQKTLQKKNSALDRVNVRRLLIKVKKFIAASSRFLVFEQNNMATRTRFLNITTPYLSQVQAQSGLNAFRVVMDESNNPPDVIDRNIIYGQIFLQPTRTAEFIVLDFTVQPTGATFPE